MKAETPMVTYLLDQHDIEKVVRSVSFFRAAVNKLLFADNSNFADLYIILQAIANISYLTTLRLINILK